MLVTRIHTGADGRSRFEEVQLPESEVKPGVWETASVDAAGVTLRLIEDVREQDRHVAPRRLLAVILGGMLEVECAAGDTRRFGTGDVVLLEDVTGEGHITRVVEAPCVFVQVALAEEPGATTDAPPD
jgi:hypothetical protein